MLFKDFVRVLHAISLIDNNEEKSIRLADMFTMLSDSQLGPAVYLCQGRWNLPYAGLKISRHSRSLKQIFIDFSIEENTNRPIVDNLTVSDVYHYLNKNSLTIKYWLHNNLTPPTHLPMAEDNLSRVWLANIVMGNGVADAILFDSLLYLHPSSRGSKDIKQIKKIYSQILPDLGAIALILKKGGKNALRHISPKPGFPFKPEKLIEWNDVETAWLDGGGGSFFVQPKYRGEELLIHFTQQGVSLFDRKLERVNSVFADITEECKKWKPSIQAILDCEVVGFDTSTGKYLPENLTRTSKNHLLYIFDLVILDGKDWFRIPFEQRRNRLVQLTSSLDRNSTIRLAHEELVHSLDDLVRLYRYWVYEKKFEGVVIKRLDGIYRPAETSRSKGRVKEYITLDVIILGYYPRSGWRTTFLIALWDMNRTQLIPVRVAENVLGGRKATINLLKHLEKCQGDKRPKIVASGNVQPDVWVKPAIVVEIQAERFKQLSSKYQMAGYTLSGGTVILRRRDDKDIYDADLIDRLKYLPEAPDRK